MEQIENDWLDELKGKTLLAIRAHHYDNTPVPTVGISFTDGSTYEVISKPGVFFEGCLINTLRKAQPIVDILVIIDRNDTMVEVAADTFPLFMLTAQNKHIPRGEFPFVLTRREDLNVFQVRKLELGISDG
jgi:hypothetical protein